MLRPSVAAGVAAAVGLLSGCGIFDKDKPFTCPRVRILADAAQVTAYRPGSGRDLTDVVYQGEVNGIASECKSVDRGKAIDMTVTLTLVAARGSASAASEITLPFFVAVIDRKTDKILNKRTFQSPVPFPEGRRRSGVAEEISEHIMLAPGHTAVDYEILVGMQLTEEQLEFNRRQRGS